MQNYSWGLTILVNTMFIIINKLYFMLEQLSLVLLICIIVKIVQPVNKNVDWLYILSTVILLQVQGSV